MKIKITAAERRKYVLRTKLDREILNRCKDLKKRKLSKNDREFIKFLKSQLERDWRKPLLKKLNSIVRKYR